MTTQTNDDLIQTRHAVYEILAAVCGFDSLVPYLPDFVSIAVTRSTQEGFFHVLSHRLVAAHSGHMTLNGELHGHINHGELILPQEDTIQATADVAKIIFPMSDLKGGIQPLMFDPMEVLPEILGYYPELYIPNYSQISIRSSTAKRIYFACLAKVMMDRGYRNPDTPVPDEEKERYIKLVSYHYTQVCDAIKIDAEPVMSKLTALKETVNEEVDRNRSRLHLLSDLKLFD